MLSPVDFFPERKGNKNIIHRIESRLELRLTIEIHFMEKVEQRKNLMN
jgi:hypothetical protein